MEKLLIMAALICQPGDRLIDLGGKIPRGLQFVDFVISVEPFYAAFISISLDTQTAFSSAAAINLPRFYACRSARVVFA
jgi:hypothetical protein